MGFETVDVFSVHTEGITDELRLATDTDCRYDPDMAVVLSTFAGKKLCDSIAYA
jgi:hypothetical protein